MREFFIRYSDGRYLWDVSCLGPCEIYDGYPDNAQYRLALPASVLPWAVRTIGRVYSVNPSLPLFRSKDILIVNLATEEVVERFSSFHEMCNSFGIEWKP